MIDIYERDIGSIRTGIQTKLSVATYPGKEFRGRISYVGDIMDEKSRTVKARVTIDNRDGLLKPGMFAAVSIHSVKEAAAGKVIVVPEEAVFLDGSRRYVFIREGDNRFVVREVLVGPVSGSRIEIKEGLKAGDAVVTEGVFTLKSEFKKKTLEADEH
jgi:cobalt-zinc-cadmium efflux system membrane fusion protein